MTKNERLKKAIKAIKYRHGVTQKEIVLQIGLSSASYLSDLISGKSDLSEQFSDKLTSFYPEINKVWLMTGEGEMLKSDDQPFTEKESEETRPRIPYAAAAGRLTEALSGVAEDECEQIPIVKYLPMYNFTIVAYGDSMRPEIASGDEMACRTIRDKSYIQWGRVYVLDTDNGIIVKRIYDDGDCIRCVSNNKDYPDFRIPKNEIHSMHLLVGLIRKY